ncbi:phage tail protein [Pyramidobacter sp. C12-8]|uniref:phage tail protein n=1 Tax=Pyramidobacter sp. C12-8 TaxID=1943580 RepID=UPI00098FFADE|nr:phage tail protein [Pyramidobacter sp. C12-8]OON87815.1 hypothetical protein B0D78_09410 [Pyramidobacter sp. C12-8]
MAGLFGSGGTTYIEGNRIGEFQINASSYGADVPVVFGTTRVAGNVIDWSEFTEHETKTEQRAGKGGGRHTTVTTTYNYTVKTLIGLCEGTISGVGKVWRGTDITTLSACRLSLFRGGMGQAPWTGMKDAARRLPYSALAYVAGDVDLNGSGTLPTFNFEVKGLLLSSGDGIDANPADVIEAIVSDSRVGVGLPASTIDPDSLDDYRAFCTAADLYISTPPDVEGTEAYKLINSILEATNSIGFWSQNKLKIVPMRDEAVTGNGVTWRPDMTPLYDLDENDFLPSDDGALVVFERAADAESCNEITVEFLNRANGYEKETVSFQILSDISKRGLRPAGTRQLHFLHTKKRASHVAEQLAMKSVFARNRYKFHLAWTYCLLEPGDLVTLTDKVLGLRRALARIVRVTEAADGELELEAEAASIGTSSPARYDVDEDERSTLNTNLDPGNVRPPLMFELPQETNPGEMAIAASGESENWGGALVWASFDGVAYEQIADIQGACRYGTLFESCTAAATTLIVQLAEPKTQLISVSTVGAEANITPCWLDGEWVNYETATLLSSGRYRLEGCRRGLYGTKAKAHAAGAPFARHDNSVATYKYRLEDLGRTMFLKLTSYNYFMSNVQSMADVDPYAFNVDGRILDASPGGLTVVQDASDRSRIIVSWDPVTAVQPRGYRVYVDNAVAVRETADTKVALTRTASKTIVVGVSTIDVTGAESAASTVTLHVAVEPEDVQGLAVSQYPDERTRVKLSWDTVPGADIAYYEVREGHSWESAAVVCAKSLLTHVDFHIVEPGDYTYWVVAYTVGGVRSLHPQSVTGVFSLAPAPPTGLTIAQDGNDRTKLLISWTASASTDVIGYEVRDGLTWTTAVPLGATNDTNMTIVLAASHDYRILVRAKNRLGLCSDAATTACSARVEPARVTGFQATQDGGFVDLIWNKSPEADVVGYEIREGFLWDSASVVATGVTQPELTTQISVERGYKYLIKAINRGGFYSAQPAEAVISPENLPGKNVVADWDSIALQDGSHDGTCFVENPITFATLPGRFSDYTGVRFVDVGGETVLSLAEAATSGIWTSPVRDLLRMVSADLSVDFMTQKVAGSFVTLEYRISRDGAAWSEWRIFLPHRERFRYLQYRLTLRQGTAQRAPCVTIMRMIVDMPDVVKAGRVEIPVGGTAIDYGFEYAIPPTLVITADGATRQGRIVGEPGVSSAAVRVIDNSGADVGGIVNWTAYGY